MQFFVEPVMVSWSRNGQYVSTQLQKIAVFQSVETVTQRCFSYTKILQNSQENGWSDCLSDKICR